ncbi:hypothetical protein K474DRAFT_1006787 [Panus rudis PR-1116 ss-1]|nr:hypothetical protein K474DRAFT_1006787 [Panus rudis PR-1116 ss-1]
MVRNLVLRLPIVRAIVPRVSRPLLPLAQRLQPIVSAPLRPNSTSRLFHHSPVRRSSQSPPPESESHQLPPDASLSQRLKHLIKSYGWYALGVYVIISTIDFTIAFAAVNMFGAEHVARVAASVKEFFLGFIHSKPPEPGREEMDAVSSHANGSGHEGLYAMIVLAYTIHKTVFLPIRVGLTAAATPKLVHWLRQRGWAGGAGTRRAMQEMRHKYNSSRERR